MPKPTPAALATARSDHRDRLLIALAIIALATLVLVFGQVASAAAEPAEAEPIAPAAVATDPDDVLVQLGDETLTRQQFEDEFAIAARTTALQQGLEPTPEVLAEFDAFRPMFLDQLATQLVLQQHARDIGATADPAEVDEVVAQVRAAQGDEEAFQAYLDTSGFRDEAALRTVIERSMTVQNVIERLGADIEVDDAEIEAWYEANQDQVQTPEGPLPLDAIRDEIASVVVQERVDERVQEIVATAPLAVFVDRL
jgi:flagellar basal body-associated protein FliL